MRRMDRESYLKLFDEHHLPLFRFAYRMTGSAADAEDIVQECFLELLRPQTRFDPSRSSARIYLFGVARNQAYKRRAKSARTPDATPEPQDRWSPEHEALRSELGSVVANAVLRLPEDHREVLILSHFEQMALADIGRVLGVETTTVKSRLQKARAHLREMLAAYVAAGEKTR